MLLAGAVVLVAVYFVHRSAGRRLLTVPLAAFGVGVFPGSVVPWHGLFALFTFFSGGVAARLSSEPSPDRSRTSAPRSAGFRSRSS